MNGFVLVILSGFSIGILGSFHCIGMCGPLALALPVDSVRITDKVISILLYNIGRAISYTFIGVIFGLLGQGFELFYLQQWLSVIAGSAILGILLATKFGNLYSKVFARFTQKIKSKLANYLRSDKTILSYLSIGVLNGFLPCGLVYIAMAASLAGGTVLKSALFMFTFGLGTLPIMALTMAFGKFISLNLRIRLNKVTPYIIMFVAVLLIIRGLALGIPYVSPIYQDGQVECCEKK